MKMNKATNFTLLLGMQIIILFSICIAITFVNESIQASGFFGDKTSGTKEEWNYYDKKYVTVKNKDGMIDQEHIWGLRHYWYFQMCFAIFLLSVARIILWSDNYWREKTSTK